MPYNPKSRQNLKPASKGEVRNPHKGRGKGTLNVKTVITKYLQTNRKVLDPFAKQPTVDQIKKGHKLKYITLPEIDILVIAQISKARNKDTWAFNSLIDRVEGRPVQQNQMLGENGEPVDPNAHYTIEL